MNTIWKENGTVESTGQERGESLWIQKQFRYDTQQAKEQVQRPKLQTDITTDIAVIGAGMAGVLIAHLLQENGFSVVLLDYKEVGSGITKNTTAKISSQHNLIYHKLITTKGQERAWEYGAANQKAIEKFEEIIAQKGIDCDFQIQPSYIYSLDNEDRIKQEVEAARKLGIAAVLTKETTLPFPVKAAVRFDHQAQFHPLKFLDGLSKSLTVYEHTRITEVRDDGVVITEQGRIKANYIVIATHYPFINAPGFYFLRMHQERQYVIALEGEDIVKKAHLDGMYLDADPQGYSFRNYKDFLLLGGASHRAGKSNPPDAYTQLESEGGKWYPNAKVAYTWSNQDCMTPDSIPYIGRYAARTPNIYVATGFNKWGMTTSMVAAMIINDLIAGRKNEFQKVFYPRRLMFSGSKELIKDAAVVTINLLSEHLRITHDKIKDIGPGEAGTVLKDGMKIGVYRDKYDKYYFVTTKCPHLGCSLEWNPNELTWDCPCHGSRFDYRGNLISNPAMRDVFDACQRKRK